MVKNYLKANSSTQKTLLYALDASHSFWAFTPAWALRRQQCERTM